MKIFIILFCLFFSTPQKKEVLPNNSFTRDIHSKSGIVELLPFYGENTLVFIKLTTKNYNKRDTTYWKLDLKECKLNIINPFIKSDIIIHNDTVNRIKGDKVICSYLIKDNVLNKISDINNKELCTNLKRRKFVCSKVNQHIKSTNIKQDYTFSDDKENEISQIYLRKNGNAFIAVNTSGEFGLKQILFLYNMKRDTLTRIKFSESIYKIHDINEKNILSQYEVGGEFFTANIDDDGVDLKHISVINIISGEFQTLKFISRDKVIGINNNESSPIKLYQLSK